MSHRRRPAPRRTLTTSLALASIGLGACAISDLASFLGDPFGDISDEVRDLDEGQLESMMGELMLRFRSYLALRDAVPFADIAPDACVLASSDDGVAFTVEADVGCIFGGRVSPASGTLIVTQEQLATNPVPVFRFDLTYVDVIVGDVSVSGTEKITETDDTDGASVRKIDLVQNGRALKYEFRAGFANEGTLPVFDYTLPSPDGDVFARITNPSTAGGFVAVILTGLDGQLDCEIRNSLWTPERLPRGTCDNGVVFGLPD